MARADLHYALAIDREIYEASQVDPTLLDPVVRVEGGLPGVARPLTVIREYQGPQGAYTESFSLADHDGRELYASMVRRVELRGEMFEDRFSNTVTGLRFADAEEHRLTFFVDGEDVGTIPVFVEAGLGGDPYVALEQAVTKTLQKSTVVWLSVPQPPRRRGRPSKPHEQAAWFVQEDGKVYVLSGPGEQEIPGLAGAREVELIVRSKEVRSRIARVPSTVRVVPGDDELFERVGRTGLSRRLNLADGDRALDRWRSTCTLVELTPRYRPAGTAAQGTGDGRAADGATPAAQAEAPAQDGAADGAAEPAAAKPAEDIHVEAQIDQKIFDELVAGGASERVARAKAKAAYVRAEKARIRAEREEVA